MACTNCSDCAVSPMPSPNGLMAGVAAISSKLMGPEGPGYESADKLARIHSQLDMLESALAPVLGDQRLNPAQEKSPDTMSPVIHGLDSINDRLASILGRIHI